MNWVAKIKESMPLGAAVVTILLGMRLLVTDSVGDLRRDLQLDLQTLKSTFQNDLNTGFASLEDELRNADTRLADNMHENFNSIRDELTGVREQVARQGGAGLQLVSEQDVQKALVNLLSQQKVAVEDPLGRITLLHRDPAGKIEDNRFRLYANLIKEVVYPRIEDSSQEVPPSLVSIAREFLGRVDGGLRSGKTTAWITEMTGFDSSEIEKVRDWLSNLDQQRNRDTPE